MGTASDELRSIPALLRRVRAGPLADAELLQITLEVLLAKMMQDRRRARRHMRDPDEDEEDY